MLLVTININGNDHYISDDYHALTHLWKAKIISLSGLRIGTEREYGGYVKPIYGNLKLLPDLFDSSDWEPPKKCPITIQLSETTEAAAVTLLEGIAHRQEIGQTYVAYYLYGPDESETATVAFTGYLDDEFSSEATSLGLTADVGGSSRDATTDTDYSPTKDVDRFQALSDLTAFFTHYFWLDGTTLYLADMLLSRGSTLELTEFDVLPTTYKDPPPYSQFIAGDDTVDGSYAYGEDFNVSPVCHGTSGNVETALGNIKTILERQKVVVRAPLDVSTLPLIGQKITLTDESTQEDVEIQMWVRAIVYNFDNWEMIIEGDGEFL